jgi:hypothetical protein
MSTISAGTTSTTTLIHSGDTTGSLVLKTNDTGSGGTTAVTIDTSQNVGIGLTPTTYKFEVTGGDVRTNTSSFLYANTLRLRGSDTYQIYESAATTNLQIGTNGAGAFIFSCNGVGERMRINSGAPILCLSGGNTSATGTGIAFPATQSASSDANTLDDYEEGTWTPSVGGSATYGAQRNGWYVKVGPLVTVACDVTIATIGTGNTQLIGGLPFSANSGGVTNGGGTVSYFANLSVGVYSLSTQLSGTNIAFVSTTSSQTTVNNTPAILTSGTRIITTISYLTSS